ncbi:hypothetical protein CMI40_00165 [Candidatus Pacearchaeota archaeon]|nr:hypothetical protein [Candidatus Pacearchaeota archaeon]|tara:strand:+ start:7412 stop:8485 length:1074 start_codon:yes stop_codon:yes gene_type:complete
MKQPISQTQLQNFPLVSVKKGYKLVDYRYFGKQLEPIIIFTSIQDVIDKFENRICYGKEKVYRYKYCNDCGSHFELDKNSNPVRYLVTCNSPFCKDEDCFKKRYMVAKKYFEVFFNAYDVWKTKRGSRWVHEVFGFARKNQFTRVEISKCKKQVYNFLKAREKKFGRKIKGIGVRDLSYDITNEDGVFYLHFHFARRPGGYEDLKELNALGLKYGLKYTKIGIKKKSGLINYFAKRHAGHFGHKKNCTNWNFSDVMSTKEYIKNFRGERKTFSCGFSRKEIKLLKNRYIRNRTRAEGALSSKEQYTTDIEQCQNCKSKDFSWRYDNGILANEPKPPDGVNPIAIFNNYDEVYQIENL